MKWAEGPRAASVTEEEQRWLQEWYCHTLVDEEFNVSHTVPVIAQRGTISQREEPRMSRNRAWNLTVRGDFIGAAKTENSERAPVRLSEELKEKQVTVSRGVRHFANLHRTGVSSGWRLPITHPWFCKATQGSAVLKGLLKCAKGCKSTCTELVPLAWAGTRGRQLGNGASHRDEHWGSHPTTQSFCYSCAVLDYYNL